MLDCRALVLSAVLVGAVTPRVSHAQQGRIDIDTIRAASLANRLGAPAETRVSVYLPPSYDASTQTRFPVVYLLHGFGVTDRMWILPQPRGVSIGALMDSLIASRQSKEMIIVMPDGSTPLGGGFWVNSETAGNWDDFVSRDLISYVDDKYRTIARPESRGIAGHSMGGYGAFYLGMRHGGVTFGAMYAMSACCSHFSVDPTHDSVIWNTMASVGSLSELGHTGFAVQALAAFSAAVAPDSVRPPFFFDPPEERRGNDWVANSSVVAKWNEHSTLLMIPRYRANLMRLRAIQFDVGAQDDVVAPGELMAMDTVFKSEQIPHIFEVFQGNHVDHTRVRLATRVLPFFSRWLVFEPAKR